jgi:S1-C subfamily serine protease
MPTLSEAPAPRPTLLAPTGPSAAAGYQSWSYDCACASHGTLGFQMYTFPYTPGLYVLTVTAGGPAARAGMWAGDHVVAIGGAEIPSLDAFTAALERYRVGDLVPLTMVRANMRSNIQVRLAPR